MPNSRSFVRLTEKTFQIEKHLQKMTGNNVHNILQANEHVGQTNLSRYSTCCMSRPYTAKHLIERVGTDIICIMDFKAAIALHTGLVSLKKMIKCKRLLC